MGFDMKSPHNKFCVLPWVSLEASPVGTVRPCCLAEDEIVDNAGEKFNLSTANFATIQNSHHMRRLRQEFIDGEQPETCRKCWQEETAGRTSKRMHTLDRLKHMVGVQDWTLDAKPLIFLDLKLGNICNLKCRICGSWSSSTFAVEEIAHDQSGNPKQSFHYQMLKQGRWPRENTVFWEQIADSVDQLRYIEFTGGEPFMIQEHFDMLQRLVDRGVAHRVEIHYNTNGTQYPEGAIDIWRHFKTVEIAFSIDDVEDRFEYQRSGAVWADVIRNLKLFKDMSKQHKNIQLQACCTVNVFNVMYLETVAVWLAQQNFDFVYWNMLHEARHFSIGSLTEDVKFVVANRLRNAKIPQDFQKEFAGIIDFMNQGAELDGQQLKKELQQVDLRRGESFAKTFPEMARALNYE
jgi:MoaA/NifB/PqqE/SkfB family radical SAM enzyme